MPQVNAAPHWAQVLIASLALVILRGIVRDREISHRLPHQVHLALETGAGIANRQVQTHPYAFQPRQIAVQSLGDQPVYILACRFQPHRTAFLIPD
jgi:hypothetical protein